MTFPSTTFITRATTITATWLQAVNDRLAKVAGTNDIFTLPEAAAAAGSASIGYSAAGTGASLTTVQQVLRQTVSALAFMTPEQIDNVISGTGTLDVTVAVQKAIDSVCGPATGNLAGCVYFPKGIYKISATLDCTNNRSTGLRRDGLTLRGAGMGTRIDGACGPGKAIIETTGSQWFGMSGFWLNTLTLANPATIGIQSAVGTVLPQTQNQHITDVAVLMHSDIAANAGIGTIALYNYGAEENTYDTLYLNADVATVLTSSNDGTQPGPVTLTSYQTLSSVHSLGVTTFSGECFMVGVSFHKAPLIIQNITGATFENTYISATGAGADQYAIWFAGNSVGMDFHGTIEGKSTLLLQGALINSKLNIVWGGVNATSEPTLAVDRTNAYGVISNCDILISLQANVTRPILSTQDGDEVTASLYSVNNTKIYANTSSGLPNLYIPLNVAANANSYNIGVHGAAAQPTSSAFAAGLTADYANITGDGTVANLNAVAWTPQFDAGVCLSAGGVFTAKLNGTYSFKAITLFVGVGATHTDAEFCLVCNGVPYLLERCNPYALSGGIGFATMYGSVDVPMTAGQTARLTLTVQGAAKTITCTSGSAGTSWRTRFSGVKSA